MNILYFASASAFRGWLESHHDSVDELWVGFHKKASGQPSVTYPQALDEALCQGWIDGVRKRVDETRYTIRFTPRRPGSVWSQVNLKRIEVLRLDGRLQAAGLAALAAYDGQATRQYSYEHRTAVLDPTLEAEFQRHATAWQFFCSQPPYYRKTATFWVMSAKREATRHQRLGTLIAASEQGQRLPQITRGRAASTEIYPLPTQR